MTRLKKILKQKLPDLGKEFSRRVSFYNINIQTNSNIMAFNDPSNLPYNSSNINKLNIPGEFEKIDLKYCQFCGAITKKEEDFCFYCGNKIELR